MLDGKGNIVNEAGDVVTDGLNKLSENTSGVLNSVSGITNIQLNNNNNNLQQHRHKSNNQHNNNNNNSTTASAGRNNNASNIQR